MLGEENENMLSRQTEMINNFNCQEERYTCIGKKWITVAFKFI